MSGLTIRPGLSVDADGSLRLDHAAVLSAASIAPTRLARKLLAIAVQAVTETPAPRGKRARLDAEGCTDPLLLLAAEIVDDGIATLDALAEEEAAEDAAAVRDVVLDIARRAHKEGER